MNSFRFAGRTLLRDLRAGDIRVLAVALAIAVAGITAVGFFTDRARAALTHNAAEMLAADVVLQSRAPLARDMSEGALARGLRYAHTINFIGMVGTGSGAQLAEVKAVSAAYPLRGRLRIADEPFGAERVADTGPAPGEAWADARLASMLNLARGSVVQLGARTLRVTHILAYEPDRGGDLFSIAPRLLMHEADVAATGLIQPGSRVEYRALFAGDTAVLDTWRQTLRDLPAGARWQTVRDARPELRVALTRAEQFLGLAALVAAILAGAAIALAARRYSERQFDASAIMRCLGATQGFVVRAYAAYLALLGIGASLIGLVIGFAVQAALAYALAGLFTEPLPPPTVRPLLLGFATALIMLLGFAAPPLLRLRDVPPLRVLRRDIGPLPMRALSLYASGTAALLLLLAWHVRDARLAVFVFAGVAVAVLALTLAAFLLIRALTPLRARVGVAWRYGLASIARRAPVSVLQVASFGAGIMVLLLLAVVRADLLDAWQRSLPANAPNNFLINIQRDQVAPLQDFMRAQGLARAHIYPTVRGRIVAINGADAHARDYDDERAQRRLNHEFNLSWSETLPHDNKLVAGRWWGTGTQVAAQFSVEQGLAEALNLKIGDRLRFRIGADTVEAPITSVRSLEWDSFQVNFFVLASPGVLDNYPASFITSLHVPAEQKPALRALVAQFPNVTVIDVDALMAKVRDIMTRVTGAVEYVFIFSLLAGLAVLAAAIQTTQDERRYEGALLRTLGASRRQLRAGLIAEFATLGALAGLLAALAASATGYVLATWVFELPYRVDWLLLVLGPVLGGVGIAAVGVLGTRSVVTTPPLLSLRGR